MMISSFEQFAEVLKSSGIAFAEEYQYFCQRDMIDNEQIGPYELIYTIKLSPHNQSLKSSNFVFSIFTGKSSWNKEDLPIYLDSIQRYRLLKECMFDEKSSVGEMIIDFINKVVVCGQTEVVRKNGYARLSKSRKL